MSKSSLTEWLGQYDEPVFKADIPIVDPHHHLWGPKRRAELPQKYINCYGERCPIVEPYLAEGLMNDIADQNVVGTVYVEAGAFYDTDVAPHLRAVGETRTVNKLADTELPVLKGIMGNINLGDAVANIDEALDLHIEAAPRRFRGVRANLAHDESDAIVSKRDHGLEADHVVSSEFMCGAKALASRGLVLDLYVYHHQLRHVVELARAMPELTLVVNHCGGPLGILNYDQDKTKQHLLDIIPSLAGCPNVHVKLGGLGMPQAGFPFCHQAVPPSSTDLTDAFYPWVEPFLKAFTPDRCMFESNFPMDKVTSTHKVLWNAFKNIAVQAKLSNAEIRAVCGGTAAKVYNLDLPNLSQL